MIGQPASESAKTILRSRETPADSCRIISNDTTFRETEKGGSLMSDFIASVGGVDDFLVYFLMALALVAVFLTVYTWVTPYREIALIRQGNMAAALSLSGALLGFVIPLASAIAHSVAWWDMLLWGAVALVVQLLSYFAVRMIVPTLSRDIPEGKIAQGLFLGTISLAIGILNAASLFAAVVLAESFPSKPIRVIVPWPAGGTVDGVARVIGPSFSSGLGRPIVVENKAGAGGSIGQAEAAKAQADGHTVLLVFDTHAVNHLLYKNLGYDPFKSFEHVSLLVTSPQVLAGAINFAPSTMTELVAQAKTNPGKVTYATVGAGSSNHLNALLLSNRTGIEMTHVPYKGGAPMMIDLVGGQVNVMFVSAPQAIPQVKAGRIKALAIGSSLRIPQLPDTPTVAETLPGFAAQSWVGMLVPAGTPREIVARLNAEAKKALADPDVRGKLAAQGFDVVGSTPGEFLAFARTESEKWAKVIRDYNVRVE